MTHAQLAKRLVSIHPFANGNGRFSRSMNDLLLKSQRETAFSWSSGNLNSGEIRDRYIAALRAADTRDLRPLFAFVRSGEKD